MDLPDKFSLGLLNPYWDAVFQNSGASGDGMGHIGHDLPYSVEFEFLGNKSEFSFPSLVASIGRISILL